MEEQDGMHAQAGGMVRQLSRHAWHLGLAGVAGPGAGLIAGREQALLVDPGPTAAVARALVEHAARLLDRPVRLVMLTHHHACHAAGAAALASRAQIVASRATSGLLRERGEADLGSQATRFPEAFASAPGEPSPGNGDFDPGRASGMHGTAAADGFPGANDARGASHGPDAGRIEGADRHPGTARVACPSIVFDRSLELDLGGLTVRLLHPGAGHTDGDAVAWVEEDRLCFAGDLVARTVAFDAGDARLDAWIETLGALEALHPDILVPGRGEAVESAAECTRTLSWMKERLARLRDIATRGVQSGCSLRQVFLTACKAFEAGRHLPLHDRLLPFSVARAYDEASGIRTPRIWTSQRDRELCGVLSAPD